MDSDDSKPNGRPRSIARRFLATVGRDSRATSTENAVKDSNSPNVHTTLSEVRNSQAQSEEFIIGPGYVIRKSGGEDAEGVHERLGQRPELVEASESGNIGQAANGLDGPYQHALSSNLHQVEVIEATGYESRRDNKESRDRTLENSARRSDEATEASGGGNRTTDLMSIDTYGNAQDSTDKPNNTVQYREEVVEASGDRNGIIDVMGVNVTSDIQHSTNGAQNPQTRRKEVIEASGGRNRLTDVSDVKLTTNGVQNFETKQQEFVEASGSRNRTQTSDMIDVDVSSDVQQLSNAVQSSSLRNREFIEATGGRDRTQSTSVMTADTIPDVTVQNSELRRREVVEASGGRDRTSDGLFANNRSNLRQTSSGAQNSKLQLKEIIEASGGRNRISDVNDTSVNSGVQNSSSARRSYGSSIGETINPLGGRNNKDSSLRNDRGQNYEHDARRPYNNQWRNDSRRQYNHNNNRRDPRNSSYYNSHSYNPNRDSRFTYHSQRDRRYYEHDNNFDDPWHREEHRTSKHFQHSENIREDNMSPHTSNDFPHSFFDDEEVDHRGNSNNFHASKGSNSNRWKGSRNNSRRFVSVKHSRAHGKSRFWNYNPEEEEAKRKQGTDRGTSNSHVFNVSAGDKTVSVPASDATASVEKPAANVRGSEDTATDGGNAVISEPPAERTPLSLNEQIAKEIEEEERRDELIRVQEYEEKKEKEAEELRKDHERAQKDVLLGQDSSDEADETKPDRRKPPIEGAKSVEKPWEKTEQRWKGNQVQSEGTAATSFTIDLNKTETVNDTKFADENIERRRPLKNNKRGIGSKTGERGGVVRKAGGPIETSVPYGSFDIAAWEKCRQDILNKSKSGSNEANAPSPAVNRINNLDSGSPDITPAGPASASASSATTAAVQPHVNIGDDVGFQHDCEALFRYTQLPEKYRWRACRQEMLIETVRGRLPEPNNYEFNIGSVGQSVLKLLSGDFTDETWSTLKTKAIGEELTSARRRITRIRTRRNKKNRKNFHRLGPKHRYDQTHFRGRAKQQPRIIDGSNGEEQSNTAVRLDFGQEHERMRRERGTNGRGHGANLEDAGTSINAVTMRYGGDPE